MQRSNLSYKRETLANIRESEMFEEFSLTKHPAGFQARKLFDNGFGVSVIPEADGESFELAVLRHRDGFHSFVCYDSGVTDDVLRYLSVDDVYDVMLRVRNLPEHYQDLSVD